MAKKPGFVVYHEAMEAIKELSYEQIGILMVALYQYSSNGECMDLPFELKPVFLLMKSSIDRDTEKYKVTCEKNAQNARTRYNDSLATAILCDHMQSYANAANINQKKK